LAERERMMVESRRKSRRTGAMCGSAARTAMVPPPNRTGRYSTSLGRLPTAVTGALR
jgi:hypothetical protein